MSNTPNPARVNPFHVQWADRYFVGRQDELRLFGDNLQALKDGQQSHVLVAGVHGTGKSFYLNKLAEMAKSQNVIGVVLDCPESRPFDQAQSILRETIKSLQEQIASPGSPPGTALMADWDKKGQSAFFSMPKRSDLEASDLQQDFVVLAQRAKAAHRDGVVVCIDEGQRITRVLLSSMKNALSRITGVLVVLSWRLASDARGAALQAREELVRRASDTEGDKDIGAAAFFTSITPMGPFQTEAEVTEYFRARLAGKAVQFSAEVSSRLGEIAHKVPRPMTALAHDVYEAAVKAQETHVGLPLLEECFRTRYSEEMKRATDLCADLSEDTTAILKALCRFPEPATALALVQDAFPTAPKIAHPVIAAGVATQLDKLSQSSFVQRNDDRYGFLDSFHRYALKIVLGLA